MKVARGRSWQPEIGMEHASRGRRSGNKGVGARWRGRFRIFSARHRSRTKVSHAENSGMTMLFFSLEVAPMSEGDSFTRTGETARGGFWFGGFFHMLRSGSTRGFDFLFWGALLLFVLRVVAGACVGRWTGQPRMPPQERQHEGLGGLGDCFTRSGVTARGVFDFLFWGGSFTWRRRRLRGRVGEYMKGKTFF